MQKIVVELRGIDYIRGGTPILRGVNWRIEAGQHWALLGANGSGKTSLLKIVTGYEWPTNGSVHVLGEEYGRCDLRELRKRIGWVSSALGNRLPASDTALDVVLSGFEASVGVYVDFTASQQEKARNSLARVGLDALAKRPYGLLSQGEQQRTLVARAMVNDPAMIILDEPCAGMDPWARETFLAVLGGLSRNPAAATLVLVTHHVEEIQDWITHVMILRQGGVLASGPTDELITGPMLSDAFGSPCEVRRADGRCELRIRPLAGNQ